jgi:hypothetical protein
MFQRVGIAWAATAVIGLGGFLAASASSVTTPAVASPVTDALASPVTDISAQAQKKGERKGPKAGQRKGQRPKAGGRPERRPGAQRPGQRRPGAQRPGQRRPGAKRPAARPGTRVVINPRGGPRLNVRIRGGNRIRLGGRDVVIVRGPHTVRWRGRRRALVPLAAIAALTIGGAAYAANAYVPVAQPVCSGYTGGGCFLHWAEVPTPEGDLIPQCVAYCPR